jgi:hypothetical protein
MSGLPKFGALATFFPNPAIQRLLLRKGVYPYDYVDSVQRFAEQQLPPATAFYNRLRLEDISDVDYQHALRVWRETGCTNFGDYHDLYLKCDVVLLADVVCNFRRDMYASYGLDPAHYITLPSFSWECLLKFTGVQLQLLPTTEDYRFF